jgi:transcriptional regulator with GAF, ATPase, and Fis domain
MPSPDFHTPDYDSLQELLLELNQERSVQGLADKIVGRLAERPHVARAGIWLIEKADLCSACTTPHDCRSRDKCLHLLAHAESLEAADKVGRLQCERELRRVPLGAGVIGRIAQSGQQVVSGEGGQDFGSLGLSHWVAPEGVRGFNGQPVKFHGETLGVVAVFYRVPTPERAPGWLRVFADHIATALTNARAFEEIERLKTLLEHENQFLHEEVKEAKAFGEVLGHSPALRRLVSQVGMVAPTDATVLILGESGTGKELLARQIHQQSLRADRALIRVNCASIPRDLYESEFFGHAKGAFTGAHKERAGRFEAANGGTLFLDEVGEIPLELQNKLLRVLQEHQYERVGEEKTRLVDVRIIAASNRDLKHEVEAGRFRHDLYYRLNVFALEIPPLRQRREDIPLLAGHFLEQAARKFKRPAARLSEADCARLQQYDWPGNVRELQNMVERAVILARGGALQFELEAAPVPRTLPAATAISEGSPGAILTEAELRDLERENLLSALSKANWKVHGPGGAAQLLGLKPTTLIYRARKLGLKRPALNVAGYGERGLCQ